jgi:type III secretion protein C
LSISIVDGKFEEAVVDQVPVVKHTEILTEAHMTEGESLLIGGISVESEAAHTSGVPGLQSVPLVGGLFRWRDTTKSRSERLFLITPRVVREQVLGTGASGASTSTVTVPAADAPARPPEGPRPPSQTNSPFRG